jgi:hypothetical protein
LLVKNLQTQHVCDLCNEHCCQQKADGIRSIGLYPH